MGPERKSAGAISIGVAESQLESGVDFGDAYYNQPQDVMAAVQDAPEGTAGRESEIDVATQRQGRSERTNRYSANRSGRCVRALRMTRGMFTVTRLALAILG